MEEVPVAATVPVPSDPPADAEFRQEEVAVVDDEEIERWVSGKFA